MIRLIFSGWTHNFVLLLITPFWCNVYHMQNRNIFIRWYFDLYHWYTGVRSACLIVYLSNSVLISTYWRYKNKFRFKSTSTKITNIVLLFRQAIGLTDRNSYEYTNNCTCIDQTQYTGGRWNQRVPNLSRSRRRISHVVRRETSLLSRHASCFNAIHVELCRRSRAKIPWRSRLVSFHKHIISFGER